MKLYVGLDVSQATTAICVVDGEGRTLAEGMTATEPRAIAAFVRQRAPDAIRLGMETGPLAVWLWNELRALDLPVICMDARHANAGLKVMLAKTDRNDAAGIAQLVRTGWFRQVHVKAETSHAVRAELATRTLLVRMRCDLENQIRGLLKTFGLVVGKAPSRLAKRAHEIIVDELAN
ncbi:IS110 family transposase, partial [Marinimicrococcus flavescens]|nr:transposase [Marinimicrococcus flavescens]